MANGLLKKLGLAAAITGSALLGVREAKAAPINWSSYTDIVPTTAPAGYNNPFEGQPISSISYTSSSFVSAPNNFSAIYFIVDAANEEFATPVGGFDVRNGQVTQGSFNGLSTWYGLTSGDTANSGENANSQNTFGGYWAVFYDADGSGNYGQADPSMPGVFLDGAEQLDLSQYAISNFTPYGATPGTFTFTANVPEPSTLPLLGLGASALALSRRRRKSNK